MFDVKLDFVNPALFFSGGVESTLLYYLYGQKSIPLTLYIIDRRNKPIERAINAYHLVNEKIPYQKKLKIYPIPKLESHQEIPFLYDRVLQKHDVVIYGANKYPDDKSIRPLNEKNYIQDEKINSDPFTYAPFMNYDKSQVIDMYFKLNIEHLLSHTHSCGSGNTIPCKVCFNCKEREWAYKKLQKKIDWGL